MATFCTWQLFNRYYSVVFSGLYSDITLRHKQSNDCKYYKKQVTTYWDRKLKSWDNVAVKILSYYNIWSFHGLINAGMLPIEYHFDESSTIICKISIYSISGLNANMIASDFILINIT